MKREAQRDIMGVGLEKAEAAQREVMMQLVKEAKTKIEVYEQRRREAMANRALIDKAMQAKADVNHVLFVGVLASGWHMRLEDALAHTRKHSKIH